MKKEKVIKKGYTLSVTSWENDGDNYKTNSITLESKELAIALAKMCKTLFASGGKGGIGNLMDYEDEKAEKIIISYMKANPELYPDKKNPSDKKLIEICTEYKSNLMDYSECYYSRVYDKATLTYSPEDVYLETIEF